MTAMELAVERATFTVREAARRLGVGRNNAYQQIKAGIIPALRIGRRLVVPRDVVERMLAGREVGR